MDNRQERMLTTFHTILFFLERHPISPEPPLLAGMRKSLEASLTKLRAHGLTQHMALNLSAGSVEHRRRALRRDRMMPLVRIAKPLLAFAPGVSRALQVPHARADAHTVATAAMRMADALAPHNRLLISAGYPRDFLKTLRLEARDLALVTTRVESAREKRSKATAAIAAEFKKAKKTVTVIEGLVMLHIGSNRNSVKYWRQQRRVSARLGRPLQRKSRARPAPETVVPIS